ncbi:EscT/YscT/HrcT family type III secretion system export apparatus protein [Salmonella enterica subsp. enterica serovar Bredeney]|nr:EscT/YscT/HrcT family type III secretion system export apparatus protein [Salmonella enterica subsp. enterica serovar Bredeney]
MLIENIIIATTLYAPRIFMAFIIIPIFSVRMFSSILIRNSFIILNLIFYITSSKPIIDPVMLLNIGGYIIALIVKEIIIGLSIGLCFAVLFWAIDSVGQLIDTMRGSTLASIFNPLLNESTSITGTVLYYFVSVIFVAFGGINILLSTIYESYDIFDVLSLDFGNVDYHKFLLLIWDSFLDLFVGFSMPFIILFTLCDLSLGFANRTSPQLNAFSLSLPIKSTISALLLAIVIYFYPDRVLTYLHSDFLILKATFGNII